MNIKNTTRHHRREPTPLIYCLQSLQGQLCGTRFLIDFFLKTVSWNEFIYFYRSDFPILGDLIGGTFRTMRHCVHRRYPTISIFSEVLLLCYLCKNISYSFTTLAMFYLKHRYSKTLDVKWWTETDSFFYRSSSWDDSLWFWTSRRSCKCLIFLLLWRLWSIQISGQ